jgi:hypothetical protein
MVWRCDLLGRLCPVAGRIGLSAFRVGNRKQKQIGRPGAGSTLLWGASLGRRSRLGSKREPDSRVATIAELRIRRVLVDSSGTHSVRSHRVAPSFSVYISWIVVSSYNPKRA